MIPGVRSFEVDAAMAVARRPGPRVWRYDEYWAALKILAPEVERLESQLKATMQAGGYKHFTAQVRNAQQQAHNAVYVAEQLETKVARLEAALKEIAESPDSPDNHKIAREALKS